MKILVIGSGGREHAIARKFVESNAVSEVYCLPGNPGMSNNGIKPIKIDITNFKDIANFARENEIDWTFVGPEIPLIAGITDFFQQEGLAIYGPSQAAAQLEGSKEFAKQIMKSANVPTADYRRFTDYQMAMDYVGMEPFPLVIKANGLAGGKGVVIAQNHSEAKHALNSFLLQHQYGTTEVLIEEYLEGEEFSLMAFIDRNKVYPMPISQDHKRAFEGDNGPNTGGMGAYCPVPQIPDDIVTMAIQKIVQPTVDEMVNRRIPFMGILYVGLILTKAGPKVIEYNVRFGDPETEVVIPRLKSDLAVVISQLLQHKEPILEWETDGITLGVVLAAEGYPEQPSKNNVLPNLKDFKPIADKIDFAGVDTVKNELVATGGRIYILHETGSDMVDAQKKVYHLMNDFEVPKTFYRLDIGYRATVK
ncbi:phosphoribosylamine--glycine ligase [Dellaglioa algida]|uniref:phosphoribosylamine--glycine ligase n=1 Tax=Dellaglioa algida TaxID=105612 RepID=UPI000BCD6F2F|nr:phosphoribosylamine--glycine ligase [Dellaglioa algida]MDK1718017.1 phosphoribosylamine--glycine ligase [Dellaglioa algida]MDK1727529.1 phosphoribosylamine--glycine ligase [Dellaglioa algida]MDK1729214.1 phosphoribosylamine--glycine ligase [Dellaglioa algida]MDK1735345.1 phosphoribosylamine--glycine ligase [Dellaglioa algida]MDK1736851.1 phosphoribosylamine--glycine ligase [Dellaglioa algida]